MTTLGFAQSWTCAVFLSVCFVGVAYPALAQEEQESVEEAVPDAEREQARALYNEGATAFEAGDFESALAAFQACYDLSRLPALLFNLASSYDRLGQTHEAVRHYEAYLAAVPEADNREYVQSRLILLQEEVATEEPVHTVAPPIAIQTPTPTEPEGPSRVGPIVLIAAGGAAAVGAVVTGILSRSSRSDLNDACSGNICPPESRSTFDAMKRQALLTDVLGGVAIALVTAGVVWWIVQPSGDENESETSVALGCSLQTCTARVQW